MKYGPLFAFCLTVFHSVFSHAVAPPKPGATMPTVVREFMREQQDRYRENELARQMREYRRAKESLQKGIAPSIEYMQTKFLKVPVLVGKFSDSGADQWKISELEKELFTGTWTTGTMKQYYSEISYNQLALDGTVYGWFKAPNKKSYYGNNIYGLPDKGGRAHEFVRDIVKAADSSVDFSQFDNDGDGYVEALFIVHEGQGAEQYASPSAHKNDIWSHQYKLSYDKSAGGGAYKTNDKTANNKDVYVDSYIIQPAISDDGKSMIEIGVFCHEFGHALGLKDLYDTDYSSAGIGDWALMAFGNWNKPSSPAHMCAFHKIELGWITPVMVKQNQTGVTMLNVEQNPAVHKLWTHGDYKGSQYFLVENRQAVGFDRNLKGSGLLIWHVDESIADNDKENHKRVDLEEADGKKDLDTFNVNNRADDGDCFPGSTNNKNFDDSSNPNSKDYNSNNTQCAVKNISGSAPSMTADLIVGISELDVNLVIKDGPGDNGNEPSPVSPWWTDSDIWIDNDSDGKADIPAEGMKNLLWARVYNYGKEDVANVKVSFYQSTPAMGLLFPSKANAIKDTSIALIEKNMDSEKVPVKWNIPKTPPKIDHYCIGVIASHDKDKAAHESARYENNLAQINYSYLVKKTGQQGRSQMAMINAAQQGFETMFLVHNPKEFDWSYRIQIDRADLPAGWSARVDPEFLSLPPQGRAEVLLSVSVPQPQHADSGYVRLVLEDEEYHTIEGGIDYILAYDDVPPHPPYECFARSLFIGGDRITPDIPHVQLSWPPVLEDSRGRPEKIVYYKIYRSTKPEFEPSGITLIDSTAIDADIDAPGFQWFDTVDISTGPYYYGLTAVDAAGNESRLEKISAVNAAVYGSVRYMGGQHPIPDVNIGLDDRPVRVTGEDGFFEFVDVPSGPHTLVASKEGTARHAIDAEDAGMLLSHLAFFHDLEEVSRLAANVTEDGGVTGADALAILRFLREHTTYTGLTGHWAIAPSRYNFDLFYNHAVDFIAYILGDLNGSWFPGSGQSYDQTLSADGKRSNLTSGNPPEGLCKTVNSGDALQVEATVGLPEDVVLEHGQVFECPVIVSTENPVGLVQFTVQYDSTVLAFLEAAPIPDTVPFQLSGVNSSPPFDAEAPTCNKNILVQLNGNGEFTWSGGNGHIVVLVFEVVGGEGQSTPLIFDRNPQRTFLTTSNLRDLAGDHVGFFDGHLMATGIDLDESADIPDSYVLHHNYPNPFNESTTISFGLPEKCRVEVVITDILGREVRTLLSDVENAGYHRVTWDGKDLLGRKCTSGLYFYTMWTDTYSDSRKLLLLR